jgi:ribosomal-protein-serine acetyltransferase
MVNQRYCLELIKFFTLYSLNRFDIRCAVENNRSRAIPERLGFKNEGIIRRAEKVYKQYLDHVVYGLLKNDNYK